MTGLDGVQSLATLLSGLKTEGARAGRQTETQGVAAGQPGDTASVSAAGGLVAAALDTSDVRTEKVAALRTQIANGSYSVPADQVADKLLESLLK